MSVLAQRTSLSNTGDVVHHSVQCLNCGAEITGPVIHEPAHGITLCTHCNLERSRAFGEWFKAGTNG